MHNETAYLAGRVLVKATPPLAGTVCGSQMTGLTGVLATRRTV